MVVLSVINAGQRWDADAYGCNARFVANLAESLVDVLAPRVGERILDLGCGDGVLTEKIKQSGASVLGADASPELVAAARQRGIDARVIDGQALGIVTEFDAVFSNAALHWMKRDPDAVIAGVARALKPGGRFIAEMGGEGNIETIRRALHQALAWRGHDAAPLDPWFFPTSSDYQTRLERAGFIVESIERFERPTPLPGDIGRWLITLAQAFLRVVPPAEHADLIRELEADLSASLSDGAEHWTADYVRLRFVARKDEHAGAAK